MSAPTFAELLRRHRRQRHLTQAELAERAGVSVDTISLLERGLTRAPQKATTQLLCEALALAPDEAAMFDAAAHDMRRSTGDNGAESSAALAEALPMSNLPVPLTPLIGRERELDALTALASVPTTRLITLTGPAGVGKTRLALELAATLLHQYRQEVVWVGLIPVQEPERVLPTIAQALGISEQGGFSLRETLIRALRERRLLLLLDNFEQALPAARDVLDLLIACPCLSALVTSRAPLNVRGERCFPVAPLALPDLSQLPAAEALSGISSITLFLERIRDAGQSVTITTPAAWRQVADICVRLDGLPLAIELAAARVRHVGLPQLHARLTQPAFLDVLADGARDLADHQRTMRSTIAWSYDVLSADEQRLFRWLGVFVGGASAEAIEAVSGVAGAELIGSLAALLDASLLQRADHGGTWRYTQLVTLRAYAQERLRAAGEWDEARRRHAEYCLTLTDALLRNAPNESEREMADVEVEYENVRAALGWALETDAIPVGLRMVAALRRFWFLYSHFLEGLDWLERFLARSAPPTTNEERAALAEAWTGVVAISHRLDQFERARDAGAKALALRQATGDKALIALALSNLANPVSALGDYPRAVTLYEECLSLLRESGARAAMVIPLLNLGECRYAMGHPHEALAYYEESLAFSREAGESDWSRALTWNNIGEAYILLDDLRRALEVTTPSYHLFSEKHDTFGIATSAFTLARAYWRSGDADAARQHLDEAERLFGAVSNLVLVARVRYFRASLALEQGDRLAARDDLAEAFATLAAQTHESGLIWRVVERIASLLIWRGEAELAARLSAAAIARSEATHALVEPAERNLRAHDLDCLRASLTAPALAACLTAGRTLSRDEAIALARDAIERAAAL